MGNSELSVREITESDIPLIINYWITAEPSYLIGMGVDLEKMPTSIEWQTMLHQQILLPYSEKKSYCLIWIYNNNPVGHSNVNKIVFGDHAYIHLHMWQSTFRKKGMGINFIFKCLPYFFQNLQLKTIYCEPYALNPAPNNLLKKLGFVFVKNYITTPGFLNFEQSVNLWKLTFEKYNTLNFTT
jgi:RimJ/RimL family protein N-acetyltransferase